MIASRPAAPRVAVCALAFALALGFADSVRRIPVQVSDSLDVIVAAASARSATALFLDASGWSGTTLRPLRYVQARWLLDLADATGLSYSTVFRGTHVVLTVLLVLTFAACLRVDDWLDAAAAAFALTVFTGLHTFTAVLREAFPVNHYAEVALSALTVFALARRRQRAMAETIALLLLVVCLLVVESGVLVWLVIVACALLRMPGIGRRGAIAATLVLLLYAGARQQLDIVSPGLGGRGTGFGGRYLEPDELRARFGANPWPLYSYNVAGGALSTLFSEPRFGVYQLLQPLKDDGLSPVVPINIGSSALVTVGLALFIATRQRAWRRGLDEDDRLALVGLLVVAASAAMCAAYIKDEIISTAGAFYALAAYAPARALLRWSGSTRHRLLAVAAATVFFLAAAPLWAFRTVGSHFELRKTAFSLRNDWAGLLLPDERDRWPQDPTALALTRRFKEDALYRRATSPSFMPNWGDRWWVE